MAPKPLLNLRLFRILVTALVGSCLLPPSVQAGGKDAEAAEQFRKQIQPILNNYCSDCHGDGAAKGSVTLDEFDSDAAVVHNDELWWKVLKNTRAGIMPPPQKPRPTAEEQKALEKWIKYGAFGTNPKAPDPGRVTLRRLNRVEYRNTIRDLMDVDFRADEEFPADDSGYGFDNIGDVLTVSPLLLEKYVQAAETIVTTAVPTIDHVMPQVTLTGPDFRMPGGTVTGDRMSFYRAATVTHPYKAAGAGNYHLLVDLTVAGSFDFDPGRCKVLFKVDGKELIHEEFDWQAGKVYHYEFDQKWVVGEHPLTFELEPLTPVEKKVNKIDLRVTGVTVQGPLDRKVWTPAKNYDRFFTKPQPPAGAAERREYATELLKRFATKAFRRPVEAATLARLVAIAERVYATPGKRFEEGIARAMVATLASPRFLFRMEDNLPAASGEAYPLIDEYALATRLSYFFWSTMPDEELFKLAERGDLRKNLKAQVARLLADPRSEALVASFTGQWLEARDVESMSINARVVLQAEGVTIPRGPAGQAFDKDFREIRTAMRRETELFFSRIVHEDLSVLDLLDSDYTFLNEKLAKHYGISGVTGSQMRLVTLPKESPRGGLLTQGTVLLVTSNPTRTSPVKRGLFVLENLLGTPPPPPPPDIPLLEESAKQFKDREPSNREILEIHRAKPLCASCHARMDPLGFGLENFNALGMWRDAEHARPIDAAGKLIGGETFTDIRELKRILKEKHRGEFYRCLSEKLLTYALGRGLEHYDVETVDSLVENLDRTDGRFSAVLSGIVESAPFQRRRVSSPAAAKPAKGAPENRTSRKGA